MSHIFCPICENQDVRVIRTHVKAGPPQHDLHAEARPQFAQADIRVFRCDPCLLDFLECWQDENKVRDFYQNNHYVYKPNVIHGERRYNENLERVQRVLPHVNQSTRLLDIGCGDGAFLREIQSHVGLAEGMEITRHHVENLRRDGITVWDKVLSKFHPAQPYDVVCMHALLEHVANLPRFFHDLRRIMHAGSQVFIEVPYLRDPLSFYYCISEYQNFYYREYHLYYFSEISMQRLMNRHGFVATLTPVMMASLTNHVHWLHLHKGQTTTNDMVNVVLPEGVGNAVLPDGRYLKEIFENLDTVYRHEMTRAGVGDTLVCHARMTVESVRNNESYA